jgi:hypothetical protein
MFYNRIGVMNTPLIVSLSGAFKSIGKLAFPKALAFPMILKREGVRGIGRDGERSRKTLPICVTGGLK